MAERYSFYSKRLKLRHVIPSDYSFILNWENDKENWLHSGVKSAYTVNEIKQYVSKSESLLVDGQTRFIVELNSGKVIGCVDLFAFESEVEEASVGILILPEERRKGYGGETLNSIVSIAAKTYHLKQLKALILQENKLSQNLFEKVGFINQLTKTNWYHYNGSAYRQLTYLKKI
ncbi:MAG: GNAT family N-acetyltransferase [Crocinitomicaceae bacterium]